MLKRPRKSGGRAEVAAPNEAARCGEVGGDGVVLDRSRSEEIHQGASVEDEGLDRHIGVGILRGDELRMGGAKHIELVDVVLGEEACGRFGMK